MYPPSLRYLSLRVLKQIHPYPSLHFVIEKWLTHRKQRVIVDGEISNWKSVLSGVPLGSVLGPILFLIYINDLEDDISSKVLKFADDTKVFRKVTNDTDKLSLQDDLNKLNGQKNGKCYSILGSVNVYT